MSRRQRNRTNGSKFPMTDSLQQFIEDNKPAETLHVFGDEEMMDAAPTVILRRMLSTNSSISVSSSLAEDKQRAAEIASLRRYSVIGAGQCGTVYQLMDSDMDSDMVMKIANSSEKAVELRIDWEMHTRVYESFMVLPQAIRRGCNVPKIHCFASPHRTSFWDHHEAFFEDGVKVPNYALMSEKIFPLQLPVRQAMVDHLAPVPIKRRKGQFLSDPEQKHCLVRIYLGRRVDRHPGAFNLRNLPLHLNQMIALELDVDLFANVMARALAIMHWKAGIDGNDVEFVLGSSPAFGARPSAADFDLLDNPDPDKDSLLCGRCDFKHRSVGIWLLDFNQCSLLKGSSDEILEKMTKAFWFNDPYYPRPGQVDKALWTLFAEQYLTVSEILIAAEDAEVRALPARFIQRLEAEGLRRCRVGSMFT